MHFDQKAAGARTSGKNDSTVDTGKFLSYATANLCVGDIKAALQSAGYHGVVVEIRSGAGRDFIACGSYDNWQTSITQNGRHFGILVDSRVFDNLHPNGLPLSDWLADFDAIGGIVVVARIAF